MNETDGMQFHPLPQKEQVTEGSIGHKIPVFNPTRQKIDWHQH